MTNEALYPFSIIEAFEVFHTVDDRGSCGASVGIFSTRAIAEIAAKDKGWYGGNGHIQSVICLRITQTEDVFKLAEEEPIEIDVNAEEENERVRKAALDKLSREEILALGLDKGGSQ